VYRAEGKRTQEAQLRSFAIAAKQGLLCLEKKSRAIS
jgi:hypothetical protein